MYEYEFEYDEETGEEIIIGGAWIDIGRYELFYNKELTDYIYPGRKDVRYYSLGPEWQGTMILDVLLSFDDQTGEVYAWEPSYFVTELPAPSEGFASLIGFCL
jgi:hypothetical protein